MVRTKVFVGNLSFTTKENELAKEFEVAGKVISANIITRGPRSLGYGFVEMDNETDAENAVKLLDKKEIDGRPINVEVAKPREEGADIAQQANAQGSTRGASTRGGRGGRTRGTRGASQNGGAPRQPGQGQQQGQGQSQGQGQQGQGQSQQGGNGSQQQFRRRRSDEEGEGARGGRRRTRGPRTDRPEGEADTRTPSTTTLFVANLPFSVEDDGFAKVLKDASLAYKSAHVVKKRTGRSKGFGFIEFDNEGDQQKALASLNNKDMEGRQLAVKVALTELRSPEDNQGQQQTSAPAKTSSPAPTKASSSPSPAKNTSSPAPAKSATPAQSNEKKDDKPAK